MNRKIKLICWVTNNLEAAINKVSPSIARKLSDIISAKLIGYVSAKHSKRQKN
jgi:hypothetical protein